MRPGALTHAGLNAHTPALSQALGFTSPPASLPTPHCPWAFPFPRSLPGAQHPGSDSALLRHKEHHPSTTPGYPWPHPGQVGAVTGGKPGEAGGKCKPAACCSRGHLPRSPLFSDTADTDIHVADPLWTRSPSHLPSGKTQR